MKQKNSVFSVLIIVVLVNSWSQSDAARILGYFPVPSISHQAVFRAVMQELARKGHDLVIITADPAYKKGEAPDNYKEIDVHDLSYQMWREKVLKVLTGKMKDPLEFVKVGYKIITEIIDMQLNVQEFKELVNENQKFDVIFTEACVQSPLVVSELFKAPVIQISSLGTVMPNKEVVGAPSHPILYPDYILHKIFNMTTLDKLNAVYTFYRSNNIVKNIVEYENAMIEKNYGPSFPKVYELQRNVDLLMLNMHPLWEGNHAYPPNVVIMWGLHQKPEKALPKDLKAYLDASKHGVIYMSFGTNVDPSLLPPEKIRIFNQVFSKLPYDVLWKWNGDDLPGKADNVKISKWLPQADLLRHPKIKLFITQGGLQSTDESITAGVPLLAFPMLADQWFNAEKYVHHKIGLKMDFETLTEENLEASIKRIIDDESFRKNVVHLRTLMNDQPQTPLEKAVWWTEYVIRHKGAKHLKSPMANISWAEYLVLDVLLLVLGVGLVILLIGSYILYKMVKFVSGSGVQKDKKKKQ